VHEIFVFISNFCAVTHPDFLHASYIRIKTFGEKLLSGIFCTSTIDFFDITSFAE